MFFIVHIVSIVPIFLLKMTTIAMPWLRRFILTGVPLLCHGFAVSYEQAVRLLCHGGRMAILSCNDYVVIALR